jgi:putative FmdB family regulatory protein
MPTYDYVCDACQHRFELFQGITEAPKKTCPDCKKRKLRRLFGTGAAIVFKGSGFYSTDYRSESYKKAAAAEKDGHGAAAAKSAEGKTQESKPSGRSEGGGSGGESGGGGKHKAKK